MHSHLDDYTQCEELKETFITDPILVRLLKTKQRYFKEGLIAGSNLYKVVFHALTEEFEAIKTKLVSSGKEKQVLIDELLAILKNYEDAEKKPDAAENNFIKLCIDCVEVFNDDVCMIKTKELTESPLDITYLDWREVRGLHEKN